MLNIITNNPFRILGVYSNAKPAEIVSNCDDMEAYMNIGQNVEFDLDLNNLMPNVVRTVKTVADAKKQINLPKDKLKHALFWFVKDNSSAHALNYLKNGDFDNIYEVFEIEDSFASRINKAVAAILQDDDMGFAIANITEMIHDNDGLGLRNDFVHAICGDAFSITEEELAHLYIDTLLEEVDAAELLELFKENSVSRDDNDYLTQKAVDELISRINAEIAKAKSVQRDDVDTNYRAGKELMKNTKVDLAKVKSLLGATDMKYQMLADDLANAIMQCGINYYIASEDNDKIEKALELLEYASKIATGKICKERCNKNLESLKTEQENAAPLNVREEDSNIKQTLVDYSHNSHSIDNAIKLIKTCAPFLVSMKETLGANDPYYLNLSTIVVNVALSFVIEEVNDAQERANSTAKQGVYYSLTADSLLTPTIRHAWEATLYMSKLNMEREFKMKRFNPNRDTLKSIAGQLSISLEDISVNLDTRTEREFIDTMTYSSQYEEYQKRFPQGKYSTEAKKRYNNLKKNEEKKDYEACNTSAKCKSYLQKHPNGKYFDEISRKYKELKIKEDAKRLQEEKTRKQDDHAFEQCRTIRDYKRYLSDFPNGTHRYKAQQRIEEKKFNNIIKRIFSKIGESLGIGLYVLAWIFKIGMVLVFLIGLIHVIANG